MSKREKATRLYAAYGSNLNRAQMMVRCPAAVKVGAEFLEDYRLVFRGVADVAKAPGFKVPIGIWRITAECEAALDRYEGVSSGLYVRRRVDLASGDKALIYIMQSKLLGPPADHYYAAILRGYHDFGFDPALLKEARDHSRGRAKKTKERAPRPMFEAAAE